MTRNFAIFAAILVILVLGVTFALTIGHPAPCVGGQVAGGAIGGPFTLVDENGETVTDKDVITGPTLVYFGYTFCPDVCPLDNARNAEAVDILEKRGVQVTPVFISVDPSRDTAGALRDFTEYLHPRMLGLTGTPEQIAEAAGEYRVYYKVHKPEKDAEEYYLVDHSTFTYLMTPDGFLGFFRRDDSAEEMANRVQCLLDTQKN